MYERVVDQYPESAEAETARKVLDTALIREEDPTPQRISNGSLD
jgi:hypothetical protein